MREIQATVEPEIVTNYTFATVDGTTTLADLFGAKDDLILIHNMGTSCLNARFGLTGSVALMMISVNRAAFVVSSPDAPACDRYASPLDAAGVSHWLATKDGFRRQYGYRSERGGWLPESPYSAATRIVFWRIGHAIRAGRRFLLDLALAGFVARRRRRLVAALHLLKSIRHLIGPGWRQTRPAQLLIRETLA